jgi:hypothetical protein
VEEETSDSDKSYWKEINETVGILNDINVFSPILEIPS